MVFDETSGQTHQLDSVRAFVLNTLCEGDRTAQDIVVELSHISYLAEHVDLLQLTATILGELCSNGLSEAVTA